jgi:hypothetical protein
MYCVGVTVNNNKNETTMKTYGIKYTDGTIINLKAANMERAKWIASQKTKTPLHSAWQVGEYWDANGNQISK